MANKTTGKSNRGRSRRSAAVTAAATAAGVTAILLASWIVFGTITISPFRWGLFAEELIVAICALFALRLFCVVKLPAWTTIVSLALLPAVVLTAGLALHQTDGTAMGRTLCLAAGSVLTLLTARRLDAKPDGVLLSALTIVAALPMLFSADTSLLQELARALIAGGLFLAVLAARQRMVLFTFLSAAAFAAAGAAGLFAAFLGAGAGVGLLLNAPKRSRGFWTIAAVLMAALPAAAYFLCARVLPAESPLYAANAVAAGVFAQTVRLHMLRALALGLLLYGVRFFFSREENAFPLVFALAFSAVARLLPFGNAPGIWMDALPLITLAAVGTAKTARPGAR